ncbi:cob(I)yrinic acid a,c-diamide adenosyltransferase [Taibaiella chishuiensis]|uniref:Corrinoid adenosyltransferase n=1 Tax=Taibaiella chishuiensis TaxID=1434707 RepID=A0A2P8DBA6_9BACT|nr:cob(I)yrinic acid a,c-diamide adenosyltransferase [Taibaiella chishuiensis]PSK94508.1 cob(I)alamin adenosyltransferase [Taibaiella chishuiensis]
MAFRVYTKTGDKGSTGLIGGTRVPKDHIRIEAYGTVDELNSVLGVVTDQLGDKTINEWILEIQDRLFTVGSSLATDPDKAPKMKLPDLHESDINWLEQRIDEMDDQLPQMKSFILPGGHVAASHAHVARCVCRRAERLCVHMQSNGEFVADEVLKYLNRLSDFLFVLARFIVHQNGGVEIPWRPRIQ